MYPRRHSRRFFGLSRMRIHEWTNGVLFALPWLIGLTVFIFYPAIRALVLSFQEYSIFGSGDWIGLANYEEMLFYDDTVRQALSNTLWWVAIALPLGTITGLSIALLLSGDIKGMKTYRTLFYMPSLVPGAVAVLVWRYLLNGDYGLINRLLSLIGIGEGPLWLVEPAWRKPALLLMALWGAGGPMVIYLAAIKNVPRDLYEAANIDGASWWQRLTRITIPAISPAILFNFLIGLIGSFQYFTEPMLLHGANADGAIMYATYLYQNAFAFFRMGYASALAWVLLLITLLCTMIALRISNRYVYYANE